ncbi:LLM class flavin-dependent oxidoreductase [Arsenicicoccus dermatophilus]|uniref:LLM class flavin-dependent oxidoreductase n=1 Tax=Arsenicicoccus dermatophilus TaxID=1076331 RepID=UPI003916E776
MPRIKDRWSRLNPRPVQDPIPLLVGGGGEGKTLRIVAEHAQVWYSFTAGEELAHKIEVLRRHCATVGRDPQEIEISCGVGGRGREGREPLAPEEEGRPLLDLGAMASTMGVSGPDHDLSHMAAWVRWRDEVDADR